MTKNTNQSKEKLLTFPCRFPMKVIGIRQDGLAEEVVGIIQNYDPTFSAANVDMKISNKGNYLSLTVLVNATSQEMLDNVYRALTSHRNIKFVL